MLIVFFLLIYATPVVASAYTWCMTDGCVETSHYATYYWGSGQPECAGTSSANTCLAWYKNCSVYGCPANGNVAHGGTYTMFNGTRYATVSCNNGAVIYGKYFCYWNGQTHHSNVYSAVTAYQSSSVSCGNTCQSQTRVCQADGTFTGSYTATSCTVSACTNCSLDGVTVAHGASRTFYTNSSPACGTSCSGTTRTCNNGVLSGSSSYNKASCTSSSCANCTLDGVTVAHGSSRTFYTSSSVACGSSCSGTSRTCTNGTLSGSSSYNKASCTVGSCASCFLFGYGTIPHGSGVTAYQDSTVACGSSCTSQYRQCNNGVLSGSYTNLSCSVSGCADCTFDGQTVPHGDSVYAYSSATVSCGNSCTSVRQTRTCNNGTLSGSYTNPSCSVTGCLDCTFNGSTVAHGDSVTAYQNSSVACGSSCTSQSRTCNNGTLSGTYTNPSCTVNGCLDCTFESTTYTHGQSVVRYQSATVSCSSSCSSVQETRTCTDGTMTGSYTQPSCTATCNNCTLPDGTPVAHGTTVPAYTTNTVPYGSSCPAPQNRTCTDGVLSGSGSYQYASCTVEPPPETKIQLSVVPLLTAKNASVKVAWNTEYVEAGSCSVTGTNGDSWDGENSGASAGSCTSSSQCTSGHSCVLGSCRPGEDSDYILQQTVFTLRCVSSISGQTYSQSATVNVLPTFCEPGTVGCAS